MAAGKGSLSCVGVGMMLGAHLGPRARATIEQADVVFCAVSDPLVELWLQQMHPDVRAPCAASAPARRIAGCWSSVSPRITRTTTS